MTSLLDRYPGIWSIAYFVIAIILILGMKFDVLFTPVIYSLLLFVHLIFFPIWFLVHDIKREDQAKKLYQRNPRMDETLDQNLMNRYIPTEPSKKIKYDPLLILD